MEFHQIIESFVQDSVNLRDQGNKFERLCVQILKIAPEFKDRFDEVLLWRDFNNRYGIKQGDDGIDIMARDTQGRWYSVQCKCIHQTSKLDLPMLKNFLGKNTITKASGELFCEVYQKLIFHTAREITDKVANALRDTRTSESLEARAYGYDWLLESGIDWSSLDESNLESLKPQTKKQLRPHQKEAFEKIHSHFVQQGNARGKVIMACGTGKSLLSIRVIDSLVDSGEMALVLAPSLALLNQLIDEFRKESLSEHFELFAVCSDTRVGSKKDTSSEDLDLQELRIPPTTDHLALSRAISHTLAACPPPPIRI